MTSFLKYVALVMAFSSASAMRSLLYQMYFDGYLADRFTLVPEALSNLLLSDDSCYRFDGFNNDGDESNRTLACEMKRTDYWTVETDTEYIPELSMRAAIKKNVLPDPEVAKECKEKKLCENVFNYNETLATDLLNESKGIMPRMYKMDADVDRMQFGCSVTAFRSIPKAVADESGKWFYVLNPKSSQEFQKVIGYNCGSDVCSLPNDEQVKCRSVYVSVNFTIINSQAELEVKEFAIPISCSCNEIKDR